MSITIDLPTSVLEELKDIASADDEAGAVTEAVDEYVRFKRLQELKTISGKVEFSDNWKILDQTDS